jgi:hypothetical protein
MYGRRNESTRLHYKIQEGDKIQYCDVMSLYPYNCKYFKFPLGYPVINVGDTCQVIEGMLKVGLIKCKILPHNGSITPSWYADFIINYYFACVGYAQ